MAAQIKNLVIEQGVTFRFSFRLKEKTSGNPLDLSGYTGRMQIRPKAGSTTVIADLTTENGGISINGSEGRISIYITDEETATYAFTSARYDLEIVSAGGEVVRVFKGSVKLDPEVTK